MWMMRDAEVCELRRVWSQVRELFRALLVFTWRHQVEAFQRGKTYAITELRIEVERKPAADDGELA